MISAERIKGQIGMLRSDGYFDAAEIIDTLQKTVSRSAEMEFLKEFVRESCFDVEVCRDQLRCLWTAYCIHQRLDADTSGYDNDLLELWNTMAEDEPETADWEDYDSFECFMCCYLV